MVAVPTPHTHTPTVESDVTVKAPLRNKHSHTFAYILLDGDICIVQEENMQLKRRKSELGESLHWSDYMSLSFTQDVSLS